MIYEIENIRDINTDVYSTDKVPLDETLQRISNGQIQLPNFQRSWKWNNEPIVKLIESVTECAPIGTIMFIETGGESRFDCIPINSVDLIKVKDVRPDMLAMDGQQRLTSLYQVLYSHKPVVINHERKKPEYRYYFMDICKALDANVELRDAIISLRVDENGTPLKGEVDYTDLRIQCERGVFPLNMTFRMAEWESKILENIKLFDMNGLEIDLFNKTAMLFREKIIKGFVKATLPVIVLRKHITLGSLSKLYEKINSIGVPLNAFDLLIARYAAQGFNLRESWEEIQGELEKGNKNLRKKIAESPFLLSVLLYTTILEERSLAATKGAILCLTLEDFKKHKDTVVKGYIEAIRYLHLKKLATSKELPANTLISTMALVLSLLGKESRDHQVMKKVDQWFWTISLTGFHLNKPTVIAADIITLLKWARGTSDTLPYAMRTAQFIDVNISRYTKGGAMTSRCISAALMASVEDFITGSSVNDHIIADDGFDVHHIFPASWCKDNNIQQERRESVVNKTPLSKSTNRYIGGHAPSIYIEHIKNDTKVPDNIIRKRVESHGINYEHLVADDFDAFFYEREAFIYDTIEKLTGISVIRSEEGGQRIQLNSRGITVNAVRGTHNTVVVLPGSTMTRDHNPGLREGYVDFRERLIQGKDVMLNPDGLYEVLNPIPMESPSYAGSVLSGRMTNLEDWKILTEDDEDIGVQ